MRNGAEWFLRISLATGFLSAVADRFGLWGAPDAAGVAWGIWSEFVEYVGVLNWFLPAFLIPIVAWVATLAEVALAACLLSGWRLREAALGSGFLLTSFGVTMTVATGIKGPLDYSVFAAAGGAFLLAAVTSGTVGPRR